MLHELFEEYSARYPFEKVNSLVYRTLLTYITSSATAQGDCFTVQDIVNALEVSRISVVTAINRLEEEGFVRQVKYHGVQICDRQSVCSRDMYLARATLEMRAAELAANRISRDEYAALGAIFKRMKAYNAGGDFQSFLAADEEFHTLIVSSAGDPFLGNAYAYMTPYIRRSRYSAHNYQITTQNLISDHWLIMGCIKNGNASMAREAMRIHMQTCSGNTIFDKNTIYGKLRVERISETGK